MGRNNQLIVRLLEFLVVVVVAVSAYAYWFNYKWLEYLVTEDNILENLTALLLLGGSLLIFYRFWKHKNGQTFWWKAFQVFFGALFFFGFGEEISWGQRILGFGTPEFFNENNNQYEVGIHNLKFGWFSVNQWIFSFGLTICLAVYYLLGRWFYEKQPMIGGWIRLFGVPIPTIRQTIFLLAGTIFITTIDQTVVPKKWEIFECIFVLIFIMSLLQPINLKDILKNA